MGLENPLHIIILLVVVLLVFGAKRLPEMGRGLGDGMRSFKDAVSGNSAPEGIGAITAHEDDTAAVEPVVVSQPVARTVTEPQLVESAG